MSSKVRILLSLAVVAAIASWGHVASVDPHRGTLGTEIGIDGVGFGTGKPKVYLEPQAPGGKRISLKVLGVTDTEIRALLSKGTAGVYDLVVLVKGLPPMVLPSGFEVVAPDVTGVAPGAAEPGNEVTVEGLHFGPKPTVLVGTTRAKVVAFGIGFVRVLVPTKLANGIYDITVVNKVGMGTLAGALRVSGSSIGLPSKDLFQATLGGYLFEVKPGPTLNGVYDPITKVLTIVAIETPRGLGTIRQFNITARVDLSQPMPIVVDEAVGNPYEGLLTYTVGEIVIGVPPPATMWRTRDNTLEWSLVITGFGGGRVFGTFSGTMREVNTNAPLVMTGGQFAVTLAGP